MKGYFRLLIFTSLYLCAPFRASACDPCALYSSSRIQGHSSGTWTASVSEQYTDYDKAKGIKDNSIRDGELVRGFSTTQFGLSYDITDRLGVQTSIPVVARRFDDIEKYRTSTSSDAGLGDVALFGTYSFIDIRDGDWVVISGIVGGIKFPTGDTGVLKDIAEQEEETSTQRHHQISSSGDGRALTFGSGSYDYITGINLLTRYKRYLTISGLQYTIRTEGDFNYEYDDDLLWSFGAGYYVLVDHDFTLASLLSLTGEYKGDDRLNGTEVEGSSLSNLFLGPKIISSFNETTSVELGIGFRLTDEDSNSTIVPDTRVSASISHQF